MKKIIALLLLFVMLLPSQVLAATSAASIDKIYFETYKESISKVKAAQKNLSNVICTDIPTLTATSKASIIKYNNAVKSKASKDTLAKAKSERDLDKKALSAAKIACSANIKKLKNTSNSALKEIAVYKAGLVNNIKTHLNGKDKLSENEFSNLVYKGLSYIEDRFNTILKSLNASE